MILVVRTLSRSGMNATKVLMPSNRISVSNGSLCVLRGRESSITGDGTDVVCVHGPAEVDSRTSVDFNGG